MEICLAGSSRQPDPPPDKPVVRVLALGRRSASDHSGLGLARPTGMIGVSFYWGEGTVDEDVVDSIASQAPCSVAEGGKLFPFVGPLVEHRQIVRSVVFPYRINVGTAVH